MARGWTMMDRMARLARYQDGDSHSWTARCSLALHLLLGKLMFVRQRLSSGTMPASVCNSWMRESNRTLPEYSPHACCDVSPPDVILCHCSVQTLGLQVLQISITGAPSLMFSLCCSSPRSVKEFGYSIGKQHRSRYPRIVVMNWQERAVSYKVCCGVV